MRSTTTLWALIPTFVLPAAGCAAAVVTPANLAETLRKAKGGETIVLTAGDYGAVALPMRQFAPRLTIDASKARFSGLTLRRVQGVEIRGGKIAGPREQQFSVVIDYGRDIRIADMAISGSRIAVAISRSQQVEVVGNDFAGTRSDGVNIAGSQKILVERNTCVGFAPIQAVYDAAGKLVTDGDHPDCIQGWSIKGMPPTADVTIVGNTAKGFMQGIFFGNPGQGGYDRITIRNNVLDLSAHNGIVMAEARDSVVEDNTVRTIKGAKMNNYPFRPVTAWINVTGDDLVLCNNKADFPRLSMGLGRCKKAKGKRGK